MDVLARLDGRAWRGGGGGHRGIRRRCSERAFALGVDEGDGVGGDGRGIRLARGRAVRLAPGRGPGLRRAASRAASVARPTAGCGGRARRERGAHPRRAHPDPTRACVSLSD